MKDYWNIRIRLILIVLIIVVFSVTVYRTESTIKFEFSSFIDSFEEIFDFFKFMFTGNILYKPSGAMVLCFFITLIIIFLPAFILLYGNNLVHVRDSNRKAFLTIFILSFIISIYFSGYLLTQNLFTFKFPDMWILKKVVLPDSWKYFERFLNFLGKELGTSFGLKNWFIFNVLIFLSGIFRCVYKIKEADFASFSTSFFFEILRLFILLSIIKYVIFIMTIKLQI